MIRAFNSDQHEEAAAALLDDGAIIVRQAAPPKLVSAFRAALRELIEEDEARWGENHPFPGIVHLLPARRKVFFEYVKLPGVLGPMRKILGHGCIVSGTNGSSVLPNRPNYAREIHVDVPRFIEGYVGMLSCLLALDPFTEETGGMQIMPGSFKSPHKPSLDEFEANYEQPALDPGDAMLFNTRSWHRSGLNRSGRWRHAIGVSMARPYMRQQFDFPRVLDSVGATPDDEPTRQLMGYHVRMPTSLEEFLLPPDQRPYRPGQE